MAYIALIDSGYIRTDNSGTQATQDLRAYNGNILNLKVAEFSPFLKRNVKTNPTIGKSTPNNIDLGSLENMQFRLRCILNSTDSSDMAKIVGLLDMIQTNGYKFMYYNYTDSSIEKNNGQLIHQIALNENFGHAFTAGEMTKWSIGTAFKHLHVLIHDMQIVHSGNNIGIITYDFTGTVLPVLTSQI